MRNIDIKKIIYIMEINKAVSFNIISKFFGLLSGPLILLLIAKKLSPEQQGFYYTFTSVMLLQMVFELGLGIVLVQIVSHEGVILKGNQVDCSKVNSIALARLSGLFKFSCRWYIASGLIFAICLGLGGFFYFSSKGDYGISWELPWLSLVFFNSTSLLLIPFISVIEGCNKVSEVYLFRLTQSIFNSIAIIASIFFGAGIFTPAISSFVRLMCAGVFSLLYFQFFQRLLAHPVIIKFCWSTEIWPFQWRVGVSSLSSFIMNLLFTPIMFHYHGAFVAGQMGMTLSLVGITSSIGYTWVQTRVPQFGIMISQGQYLKVSRLFRKLSFISFSVTTISAVIIIILVYLFNYFDLEIKSRILPISSLSIFLVSEIVKVIIIVISLYLRSFKKEPLMAVSFFSSIIAAISILVFGYYFGPIGAASSYLMVLTFVSMPLTISVFRKFQALYCQSMV